MEECMKDKNRIRIMAAALAMTLLFGVTGMLGISTNVLADGTNNLIDDTKKGSITIHKYDISSAQKDGLEETFTATGKKNTDAESYFADYAIEGVEFSYIRVSDTKQYVNGNREVMLLYQLDEDLREILGVTAADAVLTEGDTLWFSGQTLDHAILEALQDNTETKDQLENYVRTGSRMPLTDTNGVAAATNLQTGLYLIVETKVPEKVSYTTNPWFVQIPMTTDQGDSWFYDVDCYPKNQTNVPTLEKLVKKESATEYDESTYASEGDVIDYLIVSRLPHITSAGTYLTEYTFRDTLSPGLSYRQDAAIAFYNSETDAKTDSKAAGKMIGSWDAEDGYYQVRYEDLEDRNTEMTVTMTAAGLKEINEKYSDMYIVIRYTAVLHTDESCVVGKEGNPNEVVLTYKRTSTDYYDQLKDDCIVYTLALTVEKTFEGSFDANDVAQVRFTLYNDTDDLYVTAVSQDSTDGNYYISGMGAQNPYEFSLCTDSDSEAYRKLVIRGLEKDHWKLIETKTARGFSLLKSDVDVDLTENGSNDGTVNFTVHNKKSFTLPQTGGTGLYLITIIGVLVAAIGCFLFTRRAKTNDPQTGRK